MAAVTVRNLFSPWPGGAETALTPPLWREVICPSTVLNPSGKAK